MALIPRTVKKAQRTGTHHLSKYTENVPVDAYIHARSGLTNNAIAKALGVNAQTFEDWLSRHKPLVYALERARDGVDGTSRKTFRDYVYGRLPEHLKGLWDKIEMWQDHESGLDRVEALLADQGVAVRQQLWVHAMVECNFNASEACARVGIPYSVLVGWKDRDPDFPALVDQIHTWKKDFFEGGLIKLVKNGNVLATLFANKTQNRDRGYGEKITVGGSIQHNHTGSINVTHAVRIDTLNLRLETRKEILDAMRALKAAQPTEDSAIEAEPAHAELVGAARGDEEESEE